MIAVYASWDINMNGAVNALDLTFVTQYFAATGAASRISKLLLAPCDKGSGLHYNRSALVRFNSKVKNEIHKSF